MLLHARYGPSASRVVNGTTATVVAVDNGGLALRLDGGGEAVLPAAFVLGTRKDGSPNLSHAWVRTVDGAQGGTWEACHLLGNAALDAFRGYTGQSRSREPTHTWNTVRVAVIDHGGVLADRRGAAQQVAGALGRQPDPSLAARSDPWVLDRQICGQIAEHERVLGTRPLDTRETLAAATKDLQAAESGLADRVVAASRTADRLAATGALAGLSRRGRERRLWLQEKLAADTAALLRPRTTATNWPAVLPVFAESRTYWTASRRPTAGAGRTSHACGVSSTTTGPGWSPPACKQTTLWPMGSTSSATPAPPRPATCAASTPASPSTGPPNTTTPSGSSPKSAGHDNTPNRRSKCTGRL